MSIPVRSLIAAAVLAALPALPQVASAQVVIGVSVRVAPPVLPVYELPDCPDDGYIWTPGYWAYGDAGYYWVPGTWVLPPEPGLLWTPGYWGFVDGVYAWHAGYWGPHVGYYGGVNYGFGYGGIGFVGGEWRGGRFFYNSAVFNVGHLHTVNVYHTVVVNRFNGPRASFNGVGGVIARPSAGELIAERERHVAFTAVQRQHEHAAFTNVSLRASVNGGRPAVAATVRAGESGGHGVVGAHGPGPVEHGGFGAAHEGHAGPGPVEHGGFGAAHEGHAGPGPAAYHGGAPAAHPGPAAGPAMHAGPAPHGAPAQHGGEGEHGGGGEHGHEHR